MVLALFSLLACTALVGATPSRHRIVDSLDGQATGAAQRRDNNLARVFSHVQIKTSDGKCLFVGEHPDNVRATSAPVQVADCGSTGGQYWDIITAGRHVKGDNVLLVVNTLTQTCLEFDPRQQPGSQVRLSPCGEGEVTDSQLFASSSGAGPLPLQPRNQVESCVIAKNGVIGISRCDSSDAGQVFTFGEATGISEDSNNNIKINSRGRRNKKVHSTSTCARPTRTVTVLPTQSGGSTATPTTTPAPTAGSGGGEGSSGAGTILTVNPTEPVPVSRAGGVLQPTAAAEAHQRDETAERAFSGVSIRAPNGQCLFVDPTAGDFRQNLIPVSLVDCTGAPNEKWDVITEGKHNKPNPDRPAALIVSALTQGCISFDGRRQPGDTVTIFSCGGRADGGGETDGNQLFPFIGQTSFAFAPVNEDGKTCILPGDGRLDSGPCPTDGSQLFSIFE
ncbi:hypothetical protein VTH82DRAFT_544 [Thermothelomyces myriococcoides]